MNKVIAIMGGDIGTKLMAFLFAIAVWVYLDLNSREVVVREVELVLELSSADLQLESVQNENGEEIRDKIKVELTARKGLIGTLKSKDIRCIHKLKIKDFKGTMFVVKESITSDDFDLPVGVKVRILPSEKLIIKISRRNVKNNVFNQPNA